MIPRKQIGFSNEENLLWEISRQLDKLLCVNTVCLPTTTTTTTTADPCNGYTIGQTALGGKIAYILQPEDPGYDPNVCHGLIATIEDISTGIEWGCTNTTITGADGVSIGTGNQNTIDIITDCLTPVIAARLCIDLIEGGYNDWYLPSVDELSKLYENRIAIGNFDLFQFYWTSTQFDSQIAYSITFFNGTVNNSVIKNNDQLNVRAIRSF